MLFSSVLTPALLGILLSADLAIAAKHGRFGGYARAPLEKAKRAVEAAHSKPVLSQTDHRFLNEETKREWMVFDQI